MVKNDNLLSALEREAMLAVEALEETRTKEQSDKKNQDKAKGKALGKNKQKTSSQNEQQDSSSKDNELKTVDVNLAKEERSPLSQDDIDDKADGEDEDKSTIETSSRPIPKKENQVTIGKITPQKHFQLKNHQKRTEQKLDGQTSKSEMKARIRALETELITTKKQYIKLNADFDNYRKRVIRDEKIKCQQKESEIICSFLGVMDNFERAIEHAKQNKNFESLLQGIELTGKLFLSALAKHHCEPYDSIGEAFDPHFHEVLQRMITEEHKHNSIVQEHLRGYTIHGRVLRAALVVVAQKSKKSKGDND